MTTHTIETWGRDRLRAYHPEIAWRAGMTLRLANHLLAKCFSHYRINDYGDGLGIYNNTERGA